MAITGAHVARAPRIRLGMVGGGRDAFIGAVHRIAARIDDQYELVAGCFSSSAEKSMASGADLGVDPKRSYASFAEMAMREARRKDGIEAVTRAEKGFAPGHLAPAGHQSAVDVLELRLRQTHRQADFAQVAARASHRARCGVKRAKD